MFFIGRNMEMYQGSNNHGLHGLDKPHSDAWNKLNSIGKQRGKPVKVQVINRLFKLQ
jgi:hypothetical protein